MQVWHFVVIADDVAVAVAGFIVPLVVLLLMLLLFLGYAVWHL